MEKIKVESIRVSGGIGQLPGFSRSAILSLVLIAHSAVLAAQLPVNLGSAARYAVLAGSLVSNIPGSAITGDIGLSPAAGSYITGLGADEVTGTVFTTDATGAAGSVVAAGELNAAKGDVSIAYNDAAGRTPVPSGPFLNPGAGNIGGLTLNPGLYKFTSTLSITGSDVTLAGNATDVWIFQIASDLVVGNGIKVILAGGALPANIYWQVGTSATLGTTSVFKGTILADQSISMNTGATLDGRALASIAAVTLASNTITRPSSPSALIDGARSRGFALILDCASPSSMTIGIGFTVPSNGKATLKLLTTRGREIATLFDGEAMKGKNYQTHYRTGGIARGLYLSKLEFNGKLELAQLLVID